MTYLFSSSFLFVWMPFNYFTINDSFGEKSCIHNHYLMWEDYGKARLMKNEFETSPHRATCSHECSKLLMITICNFAIN